MLQALWRGRVRLKRPFSDVLKRSWRDRVGLGRPFSYALNRIWRNKVGLGSPFSDAFIRTPVHPVEELHAAFNYTVLYNILSHCRTTYYCIVGASDSITD
jgi:hypothetical protein